MSLDENSAAFIEQIDLPPETTVATPDEIAQYKKEWAIYFPDTDFTRDYNYGSLNEPQSPHSPDREFWQAAIVEAINDIKGVGAYTQWICQECHDDNPCGCPTATFKEEQILREDDSGALRVKDPVWSVPPRGRKATGVVKLGKMNISQVNSDGSYFYKEFIRSCPAAHTYQECAKRWVVSKHFEDTCNMVGLDVGYFRKKLKELLASDG